MCVNAETSISFFFIGTIINIIILTKTSNIEYLMMVVVYQFIISMQLVDFLCWTDPKCGPQNKIATTIAFLHTMLQPVVVILILLCMTQVKSKTNKAAAAVLMCMYLCVVLYKFYYSTYTPITCLKPSEECKHLKYDWWSIIGDKNGMSCFVFLIPIMSSFLLLLKNMNFAIVQALYLLVAFMLSHLFYACGTTSMFCLFAAGGPLLNYILMKSKI